MLYKAISLLLALSVGAASVGAPTVGAALTPSDNSDKIYHLKEGVCQEIWVDEQGNELVEQCTAIQSYTAQAPAPESYDLRTQGIIVPAEDQYLYGNCWAFSALHSGASELARDESADASDKSFNWSERHLTWFALNPNFENASIGFQKDGKNIGTDALNNGGSWITAVGALQNREGAALQSDYPIKSATDEMICDEQGRFDSVAHLRSAVVLNGTAQIKQALMTSGALGASYYNDSQYLQKNNGKRYCYYCPLGNDASHAVSIIGWDDTVSKTEFKSGNQPLHDGAWLVQNNWGKTWGDNGCFWLSYDDKSLVDIVEYDFSRTDDYDNKYSYTGMRASTSRLVGTVARQACVYTAKGNELLRAVAFYSLGNSAEYTIRLYRGGFSATQSPDYTQSGTLANRGYFTIDLDRSFSLGKDEKYTVEVQLTSTANERVKISVESQIYCYTEPGRSFYTGTNGQWVDCANDKSYGDVYIHVLTDNMSVSGDINGDGTTNAKDALLLTRYLSGRTDSIRAAADCNCDGDINAKDLLRLRRFLAGWIETL